MDGSGFCADPPNSTNAGNICVTNNDCPSNINNTKATCACTWNYKEPKYCDILMGNEEWQNELSTF